MHYTQYTLIYSVYKSRLCSGERESEREREIESESEDRERERDR